MKQEQTHWFVFYKDQILTVQHPDGYHIPTGEEPPVKVKDEAFMFALIRASFNQRRKTLANGLNNSPELHYSKEQIAEAIENGLDIDLSTLELAIKENTNADIPDFLWEYRYVVGIFILGMAVHWLPNRTKRWYRLCFCTLPIWVIILMTVATVVGVYQFVTADLQAFIYFQF